MEDDAVGAEDLEAARAFEGAELFLYPGATHPFSDRSLPDRDESRRPRSCSSGCWRSWTSGHELTLSRHRQSESIAATSLHDAIDDRHAEREGRHRPPTATVAMGLMAGLDYGWAVSVMPGLAQLDDRAFVGALQPRRGDPQPRVLRHFLRGARADRAAVPLQRRRGGRPATRWILVALALYVLGVLTTMAVNEPLNVALVNAGDPNRITDPATVRATFEDTWVAWHAVRTVRRSHRRARLSR